jgi:hydroxymethylbilane synthase
MLLKIGTRCSKLALEQANSVKNELLNYFDDIEIVPIKTSGDKIKGSLIEVGGKGLFIKELEEAILNKKIDIAVHSMKDVPARYHNDLDVIPVLQREMPNDVFISFYYKSLNDLPDNARIGTCAPRRIALLDKKFKFKVIPIRGNIETRLNKAQDLDGIILAYCALKRLQKTNLVTEMLDAKNFLPAVGQGALAVQFNKENSTIIKILNKIVHNETQICVSAEREFLKNIDGDCNTPLGALAELKFGKIHLNAMLATHNGVFFTSKIDEPNNHRNIGKLAAEELITISGYKKP